MNTFLGLPPKQRSFIVISSTPQTPCYGRYFSFHTLLLVFSKTKKLSFQRYGLLCATSPFQLPYPYLDVAFSSFSWLLEWKYEFFHSGLLMEVIPVEMAFLRLFLMLACYFGLSHLSWSCLLDSDLLFLPLASYFQAHSRLFHHHKILKSMYHVLCRNCIDLSA